MILSAEQEFSSGQNLTASGASTNTIDLGAPGTVLGAPAALVRDVGKGHPVPLVVQLSAAAAGTSPTIAVTMQMDTTSAFSTATTVASSGTIAGGAAGQRIPLHWLVEGITERFLRLYYTLAGTSPDYTLDAFITFADQTNDGY